MGSIKYEKNCMKMQAFITKNYKDMDLLDFKTEHRLQVR